MQFRRLWRKSLPLIVALIFSIYTPPAAAGEEGKKPLRFGVLPVIQALPLFVAQEMGHFYGEGVEVELVPFRTALEKDVAMTTGQIDGYFGDLFTPIVLKAGGVDMRMVARNYITGSGRRMFGLAAGPQSGLRVPVELADVPVAVSTNSIIEYVTLKLMEKEGLPPEKIRLLEAKNIPVRFQMLMTNQVRAATLPEPLLTLAENQGARILADDGGLDLSVTVLIFSTKVIKNRAEDLTRFLAAVTNANEVINSGNNGVRAIMIRNCRVPKPLQASFPLPGFPELSVPARSRVQAAVDWLFSKGVLKYKPRYSELVDGTFIQ